MKELYIEPMEEERLGSLLLKETNQNNWRKNSEKERDPLLSILHSKNAVKAPKTWADPKNIRSFFETFLKV